MDLQSELDKLDIFRRNWTYINLKYSLGKENKPPRNDESCDEGISMDL